MTKSRVDDQIEAQLPSRGLMTKSSYAKDLKNGTSYLCLPLSTLGRIMGVKYTSILRISVLFYTCIQYES